MPAQPLLEPMLASIGREPPGVGWAYEPKYDGIRVLAGATPHDVRLVTRNHKDKSIQFPEIANALRLLAERVKRRFIADGEIVAVDGTAPLRFQRLQPRINSRNAADIAAAIDSVPAAFIAFDLLLDGDENLLDQSWDERRAKLEALLRRRLPKSVTEYVWLGDVLATSHGTSSGDTIIQQARAKGWEGVIAKRTDAGYRPGTRTNAWQKLKVEFRQDFVIGGYTEPRRTRPYFGALLLGYYEGDTLMYAGHVGGGFNRVSLRSLYQRLRPLVQRRSPFDPPPRTNERPHWVRPHLVTEVKFSEWTSDGRLRQPIFIGLREDIDSRNVQREARSVQERKIMPAKTTASKTASKTASPALIRQIDAVEAEGEGILKIGSKRLEISNAAKIMFPKDGYTKADLLRYYTSVAPLILPAIKKRPLVLRRFPDGIGEDGFYQHQAGDVPRGVQTATVHIGGHDREQIIGGDLMTLLYTIQLGSISVDPWHARVTRTEYADYAILDLDPGNKATFKTVITVARYVKETLDELGLHGALKTSGATGMHVYLPLPARTTNETAQLLAELVATRVATAHPDVATIERSVKKRDPHTVYTDYLQNILGKTVVGVYSVRARPGAPVSTPLSWDELTSSLDPQDFTIETVLERFAAVGDLWAEAMRTPNDIRAVVGNG